MSDLLKLSVTEALNLLKEKKISATELIKAHIAQAKKMQHLNAYIELTEEHALKQANESDKRYASNAAKKLDGIPIGVKDLFCTKGFLSTACSKILAEYRPEYESTVTSKLFADGVVMIGKTSMDEFAMGSTNKTSCYGNVINPWKRTGDDTDLVPGGSSGGSVVAVAARTCMASIGSDTGGSVRQPAAFTGLVGIKPTYGRCSRYGMIAFASSLDQAGVFAHNVEDAALLLESMSGYDDKDSTSIEMTVDRFSEAGKQSIKGKRIGIPREYKIDGTPVEINELWEKGAVWLREAGAEIVEISLPHTQHALPVYYIIAPAEASSNLARYDGVRYGQRVMPDKGGINEMYEATRAAGFGAEVKRRIMIGTYVLSAGYYDAYYTKAQKVRRLISNDFTEAFTKVDAILTPTTPSPAFGFDENNDDPIQMYLNDIFTVTANLAGLPGVSVPAGFSKSGLPLGLQIIGKAYDEKGMLSVAAEIERRAGFKGL